MCKQKKHSSPRLVPPRHRCTAQGAQTVRNHQTCLVGSAKSAPPPPSLHNHYHHLCIIVAAEVWDWINAQTLHAGRQLLFLWRRIIQMSQRQHRYSNCKQCQRFSAAANDKLEGGYTGEGKSPVCFPTQQWDDRRSQLLSLSVWFGTNTRPFKKESAVRKIKSWLRR